MAAHVIKGHAGPLSPVQYGACAAARQCEGIKHGTCACLVVLYWFGSDHCDRTHGRAGGVAIVHIEAGLTSRLQPGRVHVKGDIGDLSPLQAHRQGGLQHVGHLRDQQATSGCCYDCRLTQKFAQHSTILKTSCQLMDATPQ